MLLKAKELSESHFEPAQKACCQNSHDRQVNIYKYDTINGCRLKKPKDFRKGESPEGRTHPEKYLEGVGTKLKLGI